MGNGFRLLTPYKRTGSRKLMKRLQSAPRTTPQPGSCGTSAGSPQQGDEKIPFSCAHSYPTPLQLPQSPVCNLNSSVSSSVQNSGITNG